MLPILDLPAELRGLVFAGVGVLEQQDLARLNVTCRLVHKETQSLLYRSPRLRGTAAFSLFERTLAESPPHASLVKKLCYQCKTNTGCPTQSVDGQRSVTVDELTCLKEVEFRAGGRGVVPSIFGEDLVHIRHVPYKLWAGTVDFGRDDYSNCGRSPVALERVCAHPTLEDLTLVNLDISCTIGLETPPATQTSFTPLTRLCLARCEIDVHWLNHRLSHVAALSRFEATCTESIWHGWTEEGTRFPGKGRWTDVVQALLAHRDSLKHIERSAMSQHTTIPELEVPINLNAFSSLQTLTIDQSVGIGSLGKDVKVEMTSTAPISLQDELSVARRLHYRQRPMQ